MPEGKKNPQNNKTKNPTNQLQKPIIKVLCDYI